MKNKRKRVGILLLAAGCLLLTAGLVTGFTIGTVVTPIFIVSSVFVNTLAVTLLKARPGQWKEGWKDE